MLQALALQGQQEYNQRPARPAPMEQNRTTVRNHFALKKQSVKFITKDDGKSFYITFEFASTQTCVVRMYFSALEDLDSGGRPAEYRAEFETGKAEFNETGHAQNFTEATKGNKSVDAAFLDRLVIVSEAAIAANNRNNSEAFPVVISLNSTSVNGGKPASSQTTYANVLKKSDKYSLQILKQKLVVEGHDHAYDVQEIFGIASTNDEEDNECVVCMCEPRDTTVMPCRHMCLCHECAESLRKQTNKCPICRESVQSLLRINIDSVVNESSDSGTKDDV